MHAHTPRAHSDHQLLIFKIELRSPYFALRFVLTIIHRSGRVAKNKEGQFFRFESMYYCQSKLKSNKWGRLGNEA